MKPESLQAAHGLLGLAQRAGKLQTGADMALSLLKSGKAFLALVDENASANTMKKINDACIYYHVPLLRLPGGVLGAACGKPGRMLGVVMDQGFAQKIQSRIAE